VKVTVEIEDELHQRAKEFARSHHTTLRELIITALRKEVSRRRESSPAQRLANET
jgi:hypothetical protein